MLLEVECHKELGWRLTGVQTARFPGDLLQDSLFRHRSALEGGLLAGGRAGSPQAFPDLQAWQRLRDHAGAILGEEVNVLIGPCWPAASAPTPLPVQVSLRLLLLDPKATTPGFTVPAWMVVLPFLEAAGQNASRCTEAEVQFDLSATRIGFDPGGDRLEASILVPRDILLECCELFTTQGPKGSPRLIWKGDCNRPVAAGQVTAMPGWSLPAETIRQLSSGVVKAPGLGESSVLWPILGLFQTPPVAEARFHAWGRSQAFTCKLPVPDMPAQHRVAELMLDLGSTNSKLAVRILRAPFNEIETRDLETATLTAALGLATYRKADMIADPSGARWCEWVALLLPAVRRWVGKEFNAFLGDIHLALPMTSNFDVDLLAASLTSKSGQGPGPQLGTAARFHLADGGSIRLLAEHQLVAAHYLEPLRCLQQVARTYQERFRKHEQTRQTQTSARLRHDAMADRRREYDNSWFKWFRSEPPRPNGPRPQVPQRLADPAEWMRQLLAHPEQLEHVIIFDAGGLSLDISVLAGHELIAKLSHSDAGCGGEAISARIGRKETGSRGTRYKAALSDAWRKRGDLARSDQREYRDVTRDLCAQPLGKVFDSLKANWSKGCPCTLLFTGGGSGNPHLVEFASELAQAAGLQAAAVDAAATQGMLNLARKFPEPLAELESEPVRRFLAVQDWSLEKNTDVGYDKYAIVGGMCGSAGEGGA